jgi:hypothetical protein
MYSFDANNPSDFLYEVDLATEIEPVAGNYPSCAAVIVSRLSQLQSS